MKELFCDRAGELKGYPANPLTTRNIVEEQKASVKCWLCSYKMKRAPNERENVKDYPRKKNQTTKTPQCISTVASVVLIFEQLGKKKGVAVSSIVVL